MKRPADIPEGPGVFVLLHDRSKHAYVNEARNLKERATMWASYLKAHDTRGQSLRVREWPKDLQATAGEWEFRCTTDPYITVGSMVTFLSRAGWTVIRTKQRASYHTVQGVRASLKEHCERLGIANWRTVYRRVQSGQTAEEALKIDPRG